MSLFPPVVSVRQVLGLRSLAEAGAFPFRRGSLLLVLAALLVVLPGCGDTLGIDEGFVSEPFDIERDAAGRSAFRVSGVNGDITVTGVPGGSTFRVTGLRRVRSCTRGLAEGWLEELEVQVMETADDITVRTVQPNSTGPCTLEVRYEVTVPDRLLGRVEAVNGAITVTGLGSELSIESVNGDVAVDDHVGGAEVRLTNGNVRGDVVLTGEETVDLATVNGDVDLTVPRETSAEVSASVGSGSISVVDLELSDLTSTQTAVSGTLGDGAGTIVLRTTSGTITLTGS